MKTEWTEVTTFNINRGHPYQVGIRRYIYSFAPRWWDRLRPFKETFVLPFHTNDDNVNGDAFGHYRLLTDPDFTVRGNNVVEWARNAISSGRVHLRFEVSYDLMSGREPITMLTARFSDRKMAVMFKLMFGGR